MAVSTIDIWKCDRCDTELMTEHDSVPRNGWVRLTDSGRVDHRTTPERVRLICPECSDALDAFWLNRPGSDDGSPE